MLFVSLPARSEYTKQYAIYVLLLNANHFFLIFFLWLIKNVYNRDVRARLCVFLGQSTKKAIHLITYLNCWRLLNDIAD